MKYAIALLAAVGLLVAMATSQPVVALAAGGVPATAPAVIAGGVEELVAGGDSPKQGVCAILGDLGARQAIALAKKSDWLIYEQFADAGEAEAAREAAAAAAGFYGTRIFIEQADTKQIGLADNLADVVVVLPGVTVPDAEVIRILNPNGKALVGGRRLTKPFPKGLDDWSYPYHGPDNNPLSRDQVAVMPYLTQFLAEPMFSPMVEATVAAGGRVFKAFGGVATHANQNPVLNTLLAINGYNGAILWRRPLRVGFMLDRNTLIATADVLYQADDESCKVIDARTGKLRDEIVVPDGVGDGKVWKWMALVDGEKGQALLAALVGGKEFQINGRPLIAGGPLGGGLGGYMFPGMTGWNYKDEKTNFGFGRTILGIDLATKKVIWKQDGQDYIDARGMCMGNGRIYYYSPEKFLACLDARTGRQLWKNSDPELLKAIGVSGEGWARPERGFATAVFLKCTDKYLFFAGPQRTNLVVASAADGRLVYQRPFGAVHLILRDDGFYAIGGEINMPVKTAVKMAYDTWETLAKLPPKSQCTRATGNIDSVFYRSQNEGICQIRVSDNQPLHVAPMRPPCTDGIVTANGMIYVGPWMCQCQLSLYGNIGLSPAGKFNFRPAPDQSRLELGEGDPAAVKDLPVAPGDWPCYQGDNQRTGTTSIPAPAKVRRLWTSPASPSGGRPTAPVTAGGLVFWGDEAGTVRAVDADTGKPRWSAYTAGAVFISPAVWNGRLYVGSAGGRVYAFEAATGRRLWAFRVAPADRWIPVYGKLHSTWPVAGGVLVENGVVYAAAGIANYDGTYVCALDAITGKLKWYNDSSGTISPAGDGVSLQSELFLRDKTVCFIGGTMFPNASYDLGTGEFSGKMARVQRWARHLYTPFYPYFPQYGQYRALEEHLFPDGRKLALRGPLVVKGMLLEMYPAPKPVEPATRPADPAARPPRLPAPTSPAPLWQIADRCFNQLILCPQQVILTAGTIVPRQLPGKPPPLPPFERFVAAMKLDDGSDIWYEKLPAQAVRGGVAVDHTGRIFVALEDGQVLGLGPAN